LSVKLSVCLYATAYVYIDFNRHSLGYLIRLQFNLLQVAIVSCEQFHFLQGWFVIMSNLSDNLVMDVAHCNPSPGAEVISYKRKDPPGYNQLWKKVPTGENTFYLVSKLASNCKLTIKVINPCSHLQCRHSKLTSLP